MQPLILSKELEEEVSAIVETGLYPDENTFVEDAIRTLLAARPDLREATASKLYERGVFSLGKAAEWSGLSIEEMKQALHRRGIARQADESLQELNDMTQNALRSTGRSRS